MSREEELSALIDGALTEERAAELREEIERDPELRREYDLLLRTVEAVRNLPRAGAPAELRERLRASVAGPPARIVRFVPRALAAAAVLLVAVIVTITVTGKERTALPEEARESKPPPIPVEEEDRSPGRGALRPGATRPGAPEAESIQLGEPTRAPGKTKDARLEAGAKKQAEQAAESPAGPRTEKALDDRAGEARPADAMDALERKRAKEPGRKLEESVEEAADSGKGAGAPKDGEDSRFAEKEGGAEIREITPALTLRARVERGEPLREEQQVKAYLKELGALKPYQLTRHIRSFGMTHEKSRRAGKMGRALPDETVRFATRGEAWAVGELLRGAYPVGKSKKSRAKAPASTAAVDGKESGRLLVEIEATNLDFAAVRTWLQRISVAQRAQKRGKGVRADAGSRMGTPKGEQPPMKRWRVQLDYGKPPAPKPPAAPDAAAKDK